MSVLQPKGGGREDASRGRGGSRQLQVLWLEVEQQEGRSGTIYSITQQDAPHYTDVIT
ncbi:hypothetical protein HPP92_014122, partial [Vanilla planifolia]